MTQVEQLDGTIGTIGTIGTAAERTKQGIVGHFGLGGGIRNHAVNNLLTTR